MNRKGGRKKKDKKREAPLIENPEETKVLPAPQINQKRLIEEIHFNVNKLYLKDDADGEETKEASIRPTKFEDITDIFKNLELERNQMVKSQSFILDDTMQSYELFNKKTDFRMEMPEDYNLAALFSQKQLKYAGDLTPDQMILMLDQLFLNEVLFYRGYESSQTLNICALKHNRELCYSNSIIFTAVMESQNYLQYLYIESTRNCFCQREDDMQYSVSHQKYTLLTSKQIKELFVKAEHELQASEKTAKKESDATSAKKFEQIRIRLKFHRGWFQYIERILAPREIRDDFTSQATQKNIEQRYNFIKKQVDLCDTLCKNRNEQDIEFVKKYFAKQRIINFPGSIQPKHIPTENSAESYAYFCKYILEKIQDAVRIPYLILKKELSFPDLGPLLRTINKESRHNLMVRVSAQNILTPLCIEAAELEKTTKKVIKSQRKLVELRNHFRDSMIFGSVDLCQTFRQVIRELFSEFKIAKGGKKSTKYLDEMQQGNQFLNFYCQVVRRDLIRNLKSKSRQHRNAQHHFKQILEVLTQAHHADMQLRQAMKHDPFSANLYPGTNLALKLIISRMVEQCQALLNLDILQFNELKRVFYYIHYIYVQGIGNHRVMLYNLTRISKPEGIKLIDAILQLQPKASQASTHTRFIIHQWPYYSAMAAVYKGIALLMNFIQNLGVSGQITNIRYPDPWGSSYGTKQEEKDGLQKQLRKAAYNERFKAFLCIPMPKFLSFQDSEAWFAQFKDNMLAEAKSALMEASQIFKAMKKLQGRLNSHFSDAKLDQLTRQSVMLSLLAAKLSKLKEDEKIKFELNADDDNDIPRLDFEKI